MHMVITRVLIRVSCMVECSISYHWLRPSLLVRRISFTGQKSNIKEDLIFLSSPAYTSMIHSRSCQNPDDGYIQKPILSSCEITDEYFDEKMGVRWGGNAMQSVKNFGNKQTDAINLKNTVKPFFNI